MKKTTVFTLAAVCGAFALALPDWKQPLNASYPDVLYELTNADLVQTLSVQGCKALKTAKASPKKGIPPTHNSIKLFNNNSYALYRFATGDDSGVAETIVTGSWYEIKNAKGSTFYLSINTASLDSLFGEFETKGLDNCKSNPKLAGMTQLDIQASTALVKKNTLIIKTKKGVKTASGALQIAGKQLNDAKGTANAVGTFSVKATLSGGTWDEL